MTETSQSLKDCFPKPSMVAYRRPKNLRDHLIRAKISSKRRSRRLKNGYGACQQGCKLCWSSVKTTTHTCPRTKRSWDITAPINCQTQNVIYKLMCKKHKKWHYIGETKRQLRLRIQEHRGAITRRNLKHAVGSHFARGHGKNPEAYLEVVGIERVLPRGNDHLRKRRESFWINKYHSTKFGANRRD